MKTEQRKLLGVGGHNSIQMFFPDNPRTPSNFEQNIKHGNNPEVTKHHLDSLGTVKCQERAILKLPDELTQIALAYDRPELFEDQRYNTCRAMLMDVSKKRTNGEKLPPKRGVFILAIKRANHQAMAWL
ncbi:serine/threonine-protein kinase ULK3 [Platysternon megacephalum]|uniref:Serine/threonine-protein kinase ULK3 n=1 Tax=Platysternon megacephalum TaxID=55544 RepID=A0A4D9E8Z5_9SAUR|nr:serine/threonine-protein kinase ULK3 [Platysternon megacephalum]